MQTLLLMHTAVQPRVSNSHCRYINDYQEAPTAIGTAHRRQRWLEAFHLATGKLGSGAARLRSKLAKVRVLAVVLANVAVAF